MFDVNAIGSSVSATTLREYVNQSFGQRSDGAVVAADDSVEISEIADLLSKLSELPENRARKIIEIRKAIREGTFESDSKLDVTADRLLRDISASDSN
jgi:anti-sigma28 factor (negative regulator of flagellin synthesis)